MTRSLPEMLSRRNFLAVAGGAAGAAVFGAPSAWGQAPRFYPLPDPSLSARTLNGPPPRVWRKVLKRVDRPWGVESKPDAFGLVGLLAGPDGRTVAAVADSNTRYLVFDRAGQRVATVPIQAEVGGLRDMGGGGAFTWESRGADVAVYHLGADGGVARRVTLSAPRPVAEVEPAPGGYFVYLDKDAQGRRGVMFFDNNARAQWRFDHRAGEIGTTAAARAPGGATLVAFSDGALDAEWPPLTIGLLDPAGKLVRRQRVRRTLGEGGPLPIRFWPLARGQFLLQGFTYGGGNPFQLRLDAKARIIRAQNQPEEVDGDGSLFVFADGAFLKVSSAAGFSRYDAVGKRVWELTRGGERERNGEMALTVLSDGAVATMGWVSESIDLPSGKPASRSEYFLERFDFA